MIPDLNTTTKQNDDAASRNRTGEPPVSVPGFRLGVAACSLAVTLGLLLAATCSAVADDWLYWRGPQYNGYSSATGLIDDFDPDGGAEGNVGWKRDDLGGRSTPVVMDGKLYTLCRALPGTHEEGERVVCVDATTGETIWQNRWNVYLSDVPDTRVGWSAVVADPETDSVFALGVCGLFQCIDADTGETRWSIPMHERFGLLSTYGGRTNFPIIDGDLVIVSAVFINWGAKAKPAHTMIAFDKRTGQVAWMQGTRIGPYDTTYSTPSLARLNGQSTLVFGSGDGAVWGFQPQTGRLLWQYPLSRRGLNAPPLVSGDHVFAGHSEENVTGTAMGAVVALDTSQAGQIRPADRYAEATKLDDEAVRWKIEEMVAGRSQPILINDRLWVFDDRAKLWILDAEDGQQIGRRLNVGRTMRASPLYADGYVYAFDANGRWAIYRPDESDGAALVNRGRFGGREEVHGSPIAVNGRIYLQTTGALYCLQNGNPPAEANVEVDRFTTADTGESGPAAYLQLVPAEVLLRPGENRAFRAQTFDLQGRLVDANAEASFQVGHLADISQDGTLTASPDAAHQATEVVAKMGNLAAKARVRIVPSLPWHFDFDSGEVPVIWVGARYRHVVIDDDLLQQLADRNPDAAQLYIYLHSVFVNSGVSKHVFDNTTPAQRWSQFQRFLGMNTTDLEKAKSRVDPALALLVEEGILSMRSWKQLPEGGGIQLTVSQGPRQHQGNGVMTKITTIPKGARSRCWFGHSDLSNYTIQADVRGAQKSGKLPDIGLIAQGYTLDLQGANQQLQIRTWVTQERMAKAIDLSWAPDRWYTMKLQASIEDGEAVLRGKVWPRDQTEPDQWTLEARDTSPVRSGSPGLYGNAKRAELFLDNISVTANND